MRIHNFIRSDTLADTAESIPEIPWMCSDCSNFLIDFVSANHRPHNRIGRLKNQTCCACQLFCVNLPVNRTAYEIGYGIYSAQFEVYRNRQQWPLGRFCLTTRCVVDPPESRSNTARAAPEIGVFHLVENLRLKFDAGSTQDRNLECYSLYSQIDNLAAVSRITSWLQRCREHVCCPRTHSTRLPSRVIDVGLFSPYTPPLLYETKGESAEYLTLTYCWGDSRTACLIQSNLGKYTKELPTNDLPKTFLDAIHLTKLIGIRFLWIDAICIVQDDPNDFAKESRSMYETYRNSVFTISAAGYPDPTTGLFTARDLSTKQIPIGVAAGQVTRFVTLVDETSIVSHLTSSYTSQRAWCLQERLAAPAVLHFLQTQMMWECFTCLESEDGRSVQTHAFLKALRLSETEVDHITSTALWYALVQEYTKRQLSNSSDRMFAIAGLASELWKLYPLLGAYLAGLWETHLPVGLLWICDRSYAERTKAIPVPTSLAHLPSWSWMRYQCSIRYLFPEKYVQIFTPFDVRVQKAVHGHYYTLGEFASITPGAYVLAKGYLQQVVLVGDRFSINGNDISIGYLALIDRIVSEPRLAYVLIVSTHGPTGSISAVNPVTTYYLLLEQLPGSGNHGRPRQFRRLGVAYTEWGMGDIAIDGSRRGRWSYGWKPIFPSLFQTQFQLI